MRATILMICLIVAATACSDTNLFDRQPSSERELRKKDVGFGWNDFAEDKGLHYVGVTIFPDDRYEVESGIY